MLRMGFIDDVEWIRERMPEEHQQPCSQQPCRHGSKITRIPKRPWKSRKVKTATAPTIRAFCLTHAEDGTLTRLLDVEEYDA